MKKISIIVPVYNVEKYVDNCISSILNQSYKNIELIIIDDKSTDDSYEIISKYSKKAIILQNKKNSGLSYTRNVGLDKATGDYISFIDSDDYIPENFYEELINSIESNKSDISVCDINIIQGKKNTLNTCGGDTIDEIINKPLVASSCNKLFKKEVFDGVRFEVGKINEDVGIIIPLLEKYKTSYTNKTAYNYYQRNDSIQNREFSIKRFDIFDGVKLGLSKLQKEDYKESLVFNQIILLYIYKIITLDGFTNRYLLLKEYKKRIKGLDYYKNNKYFIEFLNNQSRLVKYYYKVLNILNNIGFIFLENLIITMFKSYQKRRYVTRKVDIDDLIVEAQKQKNMSDSEYKISVVVPNYNYEDYLYERIYSILRQDYKIYELIILDDCSTDNSVELINKIIESLKYFVKIRLIENKKNSGSSFKQWQKGFEEADGNYVWIAEADDYCDKKFLSTLTKKIDRDTVISFSNTSYINSNGKKIVNSIFNAMDVNKTGHWNNSFKTEGKEEFKDYMYLNNTIPNVSSCIIKNDNYKEAFEQAIKYKQAGDWIFYAIVIQKGNIVFNKNVNNYYREHGNNVSSTFKKEKHFEEIQNIHKYFDENYKLNRHQKKMIEERYKFLKEIWKI